jgi:O-methyltransferase domain
LVVEVVGKNGYAAPFLAEQFPGLSFEVQSNSPALLSQSQQSLPMALQHCIKYNLHDTFKPQPISDADKVLVYIMRTVLWNFTDEDCIRLLQSFIPAMEKSPGTALLVNDLMSPARGTFELHIEQAYRRRDVTLMTMHNTKQRTEEEWRGLFTKASPNFKVSRSVVFTFPHTSLTNKPHR